MNNYEYSTFLGSSYPAVLGVLVNAYLVLCWLLQDDLRVSVRFGNGLMCFLSI